MDHIEAMGDLLKPKAAGRLNAARYCDSAYENRDLLNAHSVVKRAAELKSAGIVDRSRSECRETRSSR